MTMPPLKQVPSPNYSLTLISHDLIVCHLMEGGYEGSVAWLCDHRSDASVHLCGNLDGSEFAQLVPLQFKAWGQVSFNAKAISIEMPGFTAQGVADVTLRGLARVAAWLLRTYAIPCRHAEGGEGRGFCSHHDLGQAGGAHIDLCGVNDATWRTLEGYVQAEYATLGDGPWPAWALHGLPAPHTVSLPPSVVPTPSHGGAERNEPGDTRDHETVSGFPLGSIGDIQWRLRKAGANPMLGLDGVMGNATEVALATFARAVGLPPLGRMTPALWSALEKATS